MTGKIDLKKTIDGYRAREGEFRVLEVPEHRYLMVDGHGDPNTTPEYTHALEALYPVAYTLKFASARELGRDYVVPPLEGLWWADDMRAFTTHRDKTRWHWTLMLLLPPWIEDGMFEAAVEAVASRRRPQRLDEVRVQTLAEGRCVQTLHIGPYDEEAAVLHRMHEQIIPDAGLRLSGRHHEIYLSDARRVAPDRLRTILRQPVVDA